MWNAKKIFKRRPSNYPTKYNHILSKYKSRLSSKLLDENVYTYDYDYTYNYKYTYHSQYKSNDTDGDETS
jgi:hypothetical protein